MPPATTVYWAVSTVHTINVDKQYKYYDWNTNAMVCFISWPWFKVLRWLCVFSLMCRMSVVDARVHSYASGADDTKHQPRAKLCVLFFLSRRHWMPLIMCVLNQHNILAGSRCSGTLCATRYVRMCVHCAVHTCIPQPCDDMSRDSYCIIYVNETLYQIALDWNRMVCTVQCAQCLARTCENHGQYT